MIDSHEEVNFPFFPLRITNSTWLNSFLSHRQWHVQTHIIAFTYVSFFLSLFETQYEHSSHFVKHCTNRMNDISDFAIEIEHFVQFLRWNWNKMSSLSFFVKIAQKKEKNSFDSTAIWTVNWNNKLEMLVYLTHT